MTERQFQDLFKGMAEMNSAATENMTALTESQWTELKGKWGTALDARKQAAEAMYKEVYPSADATTMTASDVEAFYAIHERMTGKGPQAPLQPITEGGMTPQEARDQAAEIMRKVHDPKSDLSHSEKMQLVKKRIKLLQKHDPRFEEDAA